jgi:hypothetical protein
MNGGFRFFFQKEALFCWRAAAPPTPRAPSVLFCEKEPQNVHS